MSVTVRFISGEDATLEVYPENKLGDVRAIVSDRFHFPPSRLRILHRGRVLTADNITLAAYGVRCGDVVHVVGARNPGPRQYQRKSATSPVIVPAPLTPHEIQSTFERVLRRILGDSNLHHVIQMHPLREVQSLDESSDETDRPSTDISEPVDFPFLLSVQLNRRWNEPPTEADYIAVDRLRFCLRQIVNVYHQMYHIEHDILAPQSSTSNANQNGDVQMRESSDSPPPLVNDPNGAEPENRPAQRQRDNWRNRPREFHDCVGDCDLERQHVDGVLGEGAFDALKLCTKPDGSVNRQKSFTSVTAAVNTLLSRCSSFGGRLQDLSSISNDAKVQAAYRKLMHDLAHVTHACSDVWTESSSDENGGDLQLRPVIETGRGEVDSVILHVCFDREDMALREGRIRGPRNAAHSTPQMHQQQTTSNVGAGGNAAQPRAQGVQQQMGQGAGATQTTPSGQMQGGQFNPQLFANMAVDVARNVLQSMMGQQNQQTTAATASVQATVSQSTNTTSSSTQTASGNSNTTTAGANFGPQPQSGHFGPVQFGPFAFGQIGTVPVNQGQGVGNMPVNQGQGVGNMPMNQGQGFGNMPMNQGQGFGNMPMTSVTMQQFSVGPDGRVTMINAPQNAAGSNQTNANVNPQQMPQFRFQMGNSSQQGNSQQPAGTQIPTARPGPVGPPRFGAGTVPTNRPAMFGIGPFQQPGNLRPGMVNQFRIPVYMPTGNSNAGQQPGANVQGIRLGPGQSFRIQVPIGSAQLPGGSPRPTAVAQPMMMPSMTIPGRVGPNQGHGFRQPTASGARPPRQNRPVGQSANGQGVGHQHQHAHGHGHSHAHHASVGPMPLQHGLACMDVSGAPGDAGATRAMFVGREPEALMPFFTTDPYLPCASAAADRRATQNATALEQWDVARDFENRPELHRIAVLATELLAPCLIKVDTRPPSQRYHGYSFYPLAPHGAASHFMAPAPGQFQNNTPGMRVEISIQELPTDGAVPGENAPGAAPGTSDTTNAPAPGTNMPDGTAGTQPGTSGFTRRAPMPAATGSNAAKRAKSENASNAVGTSQPKYSYEEIERILPQRYVDVVIADSTSMRNRTPRGAGEQYSDAYLALCQPIHNAPIDGTSTSNSQTEQTAINLPAEFDFTPMLLRAAESSGVNSTVTGEDVTDALERVGREDSASSAHRDFVADLIRKREH